MMARFFVGVAITLAGQPTPRPEVGYWMPYSSRAECYQEAPRLSALERKKLPEADRPDALIHISCYGTPPPWMRDYAR